MPLGARSTSSAIRFTGVHTITKIGFGHAQGRSRSCRGRCAIARLSREQPGCDRRRRSAAVCRDGASPIEPPSSRQPDRSPPSSDADMTAVPRRSKASTNGRLSSETETNQTETRTFPPSLSRRPGFLNEILTIDGWPTPRSDWAAESARGLSRFGIEALSAHRGWLVLSDGRRIRFVVEEGDSCSGTVR